MSKSKHTDFICLMITAVMVLLTGIYLYGASTGIIPASVQTISSGQLFSYEELPVYEIDLENTAGFNNGACYEMDGNLYIISSGNYILSGNMEPDHQVVVAVSGGLIRLTLNGISIENTDVVPVEVKEAELVNVHLVENTINIVTASEIVADENEEGSVCAAIYSKASLEIDGSGTLMVSSSQNGIQTKKNLTVKDGNIQITTGEGASQVIPADTVSEKMPGMRSETDSVNRPEMPEELPEEMPEGGMSRGRMSEEPMDLDRQGQKGDFNRQDMPGQSGTEKSREGFKGNRPMDMEQGSNAEEDPSQTKKKGFKAGKDIVIEGGTITFNCENDAIHGDENVTILSGTVEIAAGDDAIHADGDVTLENGTILITASYEGIEGKQIIVNGGEISLISSDDGFNASDGSSSGFGFGKVTTEGELPLLEINGGIISVNASGDGLDSNGDLVIHGGTVYIDGPTNSGNGALDSGSESGGDCYITGGTVLALGASGMAECFSENSSQVFLDAALDFQYESGDALVITDALGNEVFQYEVKKSGNSVIFSSELLKNGETYTITVGGNCTESTAGLESSLQGGFSGRFGRGDK